MQAVEAMTRLIEMGDHYLVEEGGPADPDKKEQLEVAIAVTQAMLNTALPVARWRCFVKFESGKEEGREFTVCAVNIEDIVVALYALSYTSHKIYVTIWEQRATGADMVTGFQGDSRDYKRRYRQFLDQLRYLSVSPQAN